MTSPTARTLGVALALLTGAWIAACDECETSRDCGTGEACVDGTCEEPSPWNPSTDSDTEDPAELHWIEITGGTYCARDVE